MNSLLRSVSQMMNTALLLAVILVAVLVGIALLLLFLVGRRAWQHFRIRRFETISFKIHAHWREIVRGEIPAEEWRTNTLRCEIVRSIVIQEIGAATDKDRPGLQKFLRESGLVDLCIERVRRGRGADRRRVMLDLGATRLPEGIAPLSELLKEGQLDTRMAAVQALGRTRLAEAAEPILERFMAGGLKVPAGPLTNALMRCYMDQPKAILPYLRRSQGESRELLAHVASELATPDMAAEIFLLAEDPLPEVRACVARALAVAPLPLAIPGLAKLARDGVWFVRLRAVTALHQIQQPRAIPILLEAMRDSNQLVRIRAAAALTKFEQEAVEILQHIVDSRDHDALHAAISAFELGGGFERVMAQLADPALHDEAAARLLSALREGMAGLWSAHPADPVVESVLP